MSHDSDTRPASTNASPPWRLTRPRALDTFPVPPAALASEPTLAARSYRQVDILRKCRPDNSFRRFDDGMG